MTSAIKTIRKHLRPVRAYGQTLGHRIDDMMLGINTLNGPLYVVNEAGKAGKAPGGTYYESINYGALKGIDKRFPVGPDDVLYDLGCGMGTIVCWYARKPLKGVFGIEYDPSLAAAAKANLARVRGRRTRDAGVMVGDAAHQDYSAATVITLYNPFDETILRPVLARLSSHSGRLRILYINPEKKSVFEEFPAFRQTDVFFLPYASGKLETNVYERLSGSA